MNISADLLTDRVRERFLSKVEKTSTCWLWTAGGFRAGYGSFSIGPRGHRGERLAHRWAYELFVGPIPLGLSVCHQCDVPRCVNPAHLWLGSHAENVADMYRKGRNNPPKGDRHPRRTHPELTPRGERVPQSKLTDAAVIEIRRLYALGTMNQPALARQFKVDNSQISRIVNRKMWAHVA